MARHIQKIEMMTAKNQIEDVDIKKHDKILSLIFQTDISTANKIERFVTLSAYNAVPDQTDSSPEIDSNGEPTMTGTVAMSRDLEAQGIYRLNQFVFVPGQGVYKITGRMHPRFSNQLDILSGNKKAAKLFGIRYGQKVISFN